MAVGTVNKKRRRRGRPKLTPEQRRDIQIKRDHIKSARSIFRGLGFDRAGELVGHEIEFGNQSGEFDDAWISDNLILLFEYTTSQSGDVTTHIKKKSVLFSKIMSDPSGFIAYLRERFDKFDIRLGTSFHAEQYILRIVYCSRFDYDASIKASVTDPKYLDYPMLKYFEKLASTIRMSALDELLEFLGVEAGKVARRGVLAKRNASVAYDGLVLPEASSGFPPGYKIVSFYADAASLLSTAYVLRRDGWRGTYQSYQRMLIGAKVEAIRRKLKSAHHVFVNNLIATLPSDVHPETTKGVTVDVAQLREIEPVRVRLPIRPNSVGLIDGQHRLYSYYETRDDDADIAKLRQEQNLLVTGIIYPSKVSKTERERFEAALFLTINANQTNASTSLRQEIEVFLSPLSATSIGRQVMQNLAKSGPLAGHVESYFFDKGKLKTSSIVSYGLGPLIKLGGEDSIFRIFRHPAKPALAEGTSDEALESYVKFAVTTINTFLGAVKANVPATRWTPDKAVPRRMLTVTSVNSFLIILRMLIRAKHKLDFASLSSALVGIEGFDFSRYHSSQYNRLAEKLFEVHFGE